MSPVDQVRGLIDKQIRPIGLELLWGGDEAFGPTSRNEGQVITRAQFGQVEANELTGGEAAGSLLLANLPGPKHQVVDHFIGIGPAVSTCQTTTNSLRAMATMALRRPIRRTPGRHCSGQN